MSIIYGFILLRAFIYLYFRRSPDPNPHQAMFKAIEGLQESLDGTLGFAEASRIAEQLTTARNSDRDEIVSLANAVGEFLQTEQQHSPVDKPKIWQRLNKDIDSLGHSIGQRWHRNIISAMLFFWVAFVIDYIVVLIRGGANLDSQVIQWRAPLLFIQTLIGFLVVVANFSG
jgi:hypothetical protein